MVSMGAVLCEQLVRCGKPTCRCATGRGLHGPYPYLFLRELGRLKKHYVRKDELEAVKASLATREALRSAGKAIDEAARHIGGDFLIHMIKKGIKWGLIP
jgi:hypothetical protein